MVVATPVVAAADTGRTVAAYAEAVPGAHVAQGPRERDLSGKDMGGLRAPGSDFRGRNLPHVRLHHAQLHHSKFQKAVLHHGNFDHADLRHAVFHNADLRHATAHHARMNHASLGRSRMNRAVAHLSDLRDVSLRHATAHHVDFQDAQMHRADLRRSGMHHARFTGSTLHKARFDHAIAHHANFVAVRAHGAVFNRATLHRTRFQSADLQGARFRKANLRKADFSSRGSGRSKLAAITPACGSTCSGADLSGADFSGANLSGANFDGADLENAVLRGANLTGASLVGADLRNADLTGATWSGANFTNATTIGTNFGGAQTPSTGASTTATFCTNQHAAATSTTSLGQGLVLVSYTGMSSSGTGTAVVEAPGGVQLDVAFQCTTGSYTRSGSYPNYLYTYPFTLTVTGARGTFTSPVSGLTVDSRAFSGTISRDSLGHMSWAVSSTATYSVHGITATGALSVTSAHNWTMSVSSGSGSLTTPDGTFTLTQFSGSLAHADGQTSGQVLIVASGSHPWISALPVSWNKSMTLTIGIAGQSGSVAVSSTLTIDATSSAGGNVSKITLTGAMPSGDWATQGIKMRGIGQVYLKQQPVSISGWYQGQGYQGQTAAIWQVWGTFTGNVSLGNDASLVAGSLDINSKTNGFTGWAQVALSKGSAAAFTAGLSYQNAQEWTLTANGGATNGWSPISGLSIPGEAFTGTVAVTGSTTTWNVSVGSAASPLTWTAANGISLSAWYSLGNTCPVSDCGSASGIFLSSHDGYLTGVSPSFSAATSGALLADGSWATFTATGLGTTSFTGPNGGSVTLGSPSVTLWQGSASRDAVTGLTMPDVNTSGSGVGVVFCGSFAATQVPYVGSTQPAQGCVSWSPSGIVLGVTNLGATMPGGTATASGSGDSVSGVNVSGGSIDGLAWTNLAAKPIVKIQDTALTLTAQTTSLSGTITLPGVVMQALGKPMEPTAIPATATFSDPSWTAEDASFSLRATVPLQYTSNGFSLQDFFITASESGKAFSFAVGVDATYSINGTKAPVTMSLAYAKSALRLQLTATGTQGGADPDPCNCDGVNGAFQSPQNYSYLSNAFMGVPGMHLWSITGQLVVAAGEPGFGIGATVYQDPSEMASIMQGSTWLQGKFYVNLDLLEPCLDFGFTSPDPNTYLQIEGGVLEAESFHISVAPAAGCLVGNDSIPGGIAVSFSSSFGGNGNFDFDLAVDPAAGTYYESVSISDITMGGITFEDGTIVISAGPGDVSVNFDTDFTLPPSGDFTTTFAASMSGSDMMLDGLVSLTDWDMAGGTFDVQNMTFQMDFNTGQGTFSSSASGLMSFSAKNKIAFTADVSYGNNELQNFDFDFDYTHGGSSFDYKLDYSSANHTLSGGIDLKYTKETSHRFTSGGHRYVRHAYMTISLDYSMNTNNPSQASLTIAFSGSSSDGDLQVSGGATLSTMPGTDDSAWASLHVHISHMGSWNDSWTW